MRTISLKKLTLLLAGTLAGVLMAIGQPSPPLPPGLTPPPLTVKFGDPPVIGIAENQIFNYIVGFELPTNYVVRTGLANISAPVWNATEAQKLKKLRLEVAGVSTNTISQLGDPLVPEALRTRCIEIYFDLGWVEFFEVANNGEIEMLWTSEPGFQHYMALAKAHSPEVAEIWPIKYVNNRPLYALDAGRITKLRTWSSSP